VSSPPRTTGAAGGPARLTGGGKDGYGWFAVTDGCGGIAEADLPRVFDVAYRSEAARTPRAADETHDAAAEPRATAGGGLGLAIVRGLVEAHGGRVSVANIDGGCRFEVGIPTG
jgi:Signal transduction histidine kinase